MSDAYAQAGVDTTEAARGVEALVSVLRTIDPGRRSRSVLGSGHYASVLEIAPNLGIALSTDGVGSKLVLAEQLGRLDSVGIDCVAMNVNDIVCVGAEPLAMLDYIAVEQVDARALSEIAVGLKRGAEQAGVEIPGGELAVLPELIRGHPSPHGFDLCGACFGTVALDAIVTGELCTPGDALIGLPASGLHSNGYTLARRVLAGEELAERLPGYAGSVADALLEPTVIYVRAALELLRSDIPVHGLAHITGDGIQNLTRLNRAVGFVIDAPLPVPAICALICARAGLGAREAYDTFNMGCGFVAVVPAARAAEAAALLGVHHPGSGVIGRVTANGGAEIRRG
ncbi:MAG: phosphoribosylformylglycinamidine cyclo-ligase [Solirubrobacteraceae bacterium]